MTPTFFIIQPFNKIFFESENLKLIQKVIGTIWIIAILSSCQSKKATEKNQNEIVTADSVSVKRETVENNKKIDTTNTHAYESDCIRGQAEPILKKDTYPNSTFKINEDGLTGTETVDLPSGDKLVITNGGCEYYVLTFRFETSRFEADTTDVNFWSSKIVDLMNEITDGIDAPIDLKKGTQTLSEHIKKNPIQLYEDITFEPGEIRTYLTIDRIQKIDNKRYALEISYIVGPL